MPPPRNRYPLTNPMHLRHILTPQLPSHITKHFRWRLLNLLDLILQRVETERFVCTQCVDVGARVHEACACDGGPVVDYLVEGVFFIGVRRVEDVD